MQEEIIDLNYDSIFQPINKDISSLLIPKNTNSNSSYDLYSPVDAIVKPFALANIPSGYKIYIPEGYIGLVSPRRSQAVRYAMFFPAQIIHALDTNEIMLNFMHFGTDDMEIRKGDSIAQVTILKVLDFQSGVGNVRD